MEECGCLKNFSKTSSIEVALSEKKQLLGVAA